MECLEICTDDRAASEFCTKNEPGFVPDFGYKVRLDRCCDQDACKCICHYQCETFASRIHSLQVIFANWLIDWLKLSGVESRNLSDIGILNLCHRTFKRRGLSNFQAKLCPRGKEVRVWKFKQVLYVPEKISLRSKSMHYVREAGLFRSKQLQTYGELCSRIERYSTKSQTHAGRTVINLY